MSSSSSYESSSYESSDDDEKEGQESTNEEESELTLEQIKEGTFQSGNKKRGLGGAGKVEILREKGISRYNSKAPARHF